MSELNKKELPENYYLLADELYLLLKKIGGLEKMQFFGVRAIHTSNFYYWKIRYNGQNLLVRVTKDLNDTNKKVLLPREKLINPLL
nr:hypothetical protein [Neobacillus sp. Marseille-Q6967]